MSYFNGDLHGYYDSTGAYIAPKKTTKIYCDSCAPKEIETWNVDAKIGREHWDTGYRWAPVFGTECSCCKNKC